MPMIGSESSRANLELTLSPTSVCNVFVFTFHDVTAVCVLFINKEEFVPVFLCTVLCVCIQVCVAVYRSLYLYTCLCHCVYIHVCVGTHVCLCLCVYRSVSVCLYT